MKFESYNPSPQEIKKAEEIMTPEQIQASLTREKYHYQTFDSFDDFKLEKENKRPTPTETEKEQMDASLASLGKLFKDSDVNWNLDGALNISLIKGEYIGAHKDVDISIEESEISKVDAQLNKNGYGLFISHREDKNKNIMERVGSKNFSDEEKKHLMMAAINELGEIDRERALNFVDVHLIKRDQSGKVIGYNNVELPDSWSETQPDFSKGEKINLAHPAKITYFKIHCDDDRGYDMTDLYTLKKTGKLTINDIDEVEKLLDQESTNRKNQAELLFGGLAEKIKPEMNKEDIFNIFLKEPIIDNAAKQNPRQFEKLAQNIANSSKSKNEIINLSLDDLGINSLAKKLKDRITDLKEK